jgi:glycosyltransferase involved in cell wall biosynthesis
MRVLAVTHSLGSNGAAWVLFHLLKAIKSAGGSVDVLYSGEELLVPLFKDAGIRIIDRAQTAEYDVALVNTLPDHARVAELAAALPVLFWVHEGVAGRDNGLAEATEWIRAFRHSSRIVFDCQWQYDTVFKSFLGAIESHRISHVSPAFIAPPPGHAESVRNPASIISLGTLYPRKRPADLVEAVVRLNTPNVHCTLVGDHSSLDSNGPRMSQLLAENHSLFTLTGEVFDPKKGELLRHAGVFCSASGDETFNMAAMEAATLRLPLALTDLPCYEGIWQHGINALLSPVGAIDCLSWNLKALTSDPALADRLGQAAQRTAARFTMDRFLKSMSNVLIEAIQDPAPRPVS